MDAQRLAWLPVIALMLVLPSCSIPNLRPPEIDQCLPDSFNGVTSEENSAEVGIDEFFTDPILTGLIDEGLAGNQQLKILGEDIQIANNEVFKRRGAYIPFLSIGGRAAVDKSSLFMPYGAAESQLLTPTGRHFPEPLPDFLGTVNLSWQVDIWRQLRNTRDSAALRYLGSIEGRNFVVTRLVAEIAENYYNLLALDRRMENLDRTILLQEQSLQIAISKKEAARGTELAVQRFQAEVYRNQSEKLIIAQEIIETENRINFLVGRFPMPVERSTEFFELRLHALNLGVPADLLRNRPDIRQAERELSAAGLDIAVARANFYPKGIISAGTGFEAFNPKYLFTTPDSLIYGVAGELVAPLLNKNAIQADYMTANALQLQALYNYQRVVLNAFTEVINRYNMVQNYTRSIEIKQQQLESLEASVKAASSLFQAARVEYVDVLFAQRDLRDARMVLIDTKKLQLTAIIDTYQALGGGLIRFSYPEAELVPPDSLLPPAPGATTDPQGNENPEGAAPQSKPKSVPADGAEEPKANAVPADAVLPDAASAGAAAGATQKRYAKAFPPGTANKAKPVLNLSPPGEVKP